MRSPLSLKTTVLPLIVLACLVKVAEAGPPSIVKLQDFQFGKFAGGGGNSGTVTIDASGARTASGNVMLIGSASSPAVFSLSGSVGRAYTLTIPASVTLTSGADQMILSSITPSIPMSGNIPQGGTLQFTVGGTLTVGATQRSSTYSGNMLVSVR